MQYGSSYVLNWLKLCIPRWKGATAPLKVQGASRIHLVDYKDVSKIQEQLSIVQIFIYDSNNINGTYYLWFIAFLSFCAFIKFDVIDTFIFHF